jgi:hypothetical protein
LGRGRIFCGDPILAPGHPQCDWRSAREPLASLFYDVRHRVEFWQPAGPLAPKL